MVSFLTLLKLILFVILNPQHINQNGNSALRRLNSAQRSTQLFSGQSAEVSLTLSTSSEPVLNGKLQRSIWLAEPNETASCDNIDFKRLGSGGSQASQQMDNLTKSRRLSHIR